MIEGLEKEAEQQRQAQMDVEPCSEFDNFVMNLSARFVKIIGTEIRQEIENSLIEFAEFLDFSYISLFESQYLTREIHMLQTRSTTAVRMPLTIIFNEQFPWCAEKLLQNEIVKFSNPDELPEMAVADKENYVRLGIKSTFILPITIEFHTFGYIMANTIETERTWTDLDIWQVQMVAKVLGNALYRLHKEEKQRWQLEYEKLVSYFSSKFINISESDIEKEIENGLYQLLDFFHADRCDIAKSGFADGSMQIRVVQSVWRPGFEPVPSYADVDFQKIIPSFIQMMKEKKTLIINTIEDLPDEAIDIKMFCETMGIKSSFTVPLSVGGTTLWTLGIDAVRKQTTWSDEDIRCAKILGDIFANALIRKQNQETILERIRLEGMVSHLSSQFINVPADQVEDKIQHGLKNIVEIMGVEQASCLQFLEEMKEFRVIWSRTLPEVEELPPIMNADQYPWTTQKLLAGESICFSNISELPNEARLDSVSFKKLGIKSLLIIPLFVDEKVKYVFCASYLKAELTWSENLSMQLHLIGDIFSNALDGKEQEEKIRKAFSEIKRLKNRLEQENVYLREKIELQHQHEEIIGNSIVIKKVLSRAEEVAKTDSTVLILGETGTGKELLARAIHKISTRKDRPLVKVNCAALPSSLIESELFGHEKGAYTNAHSSQIGRFEIANGSTIFLDEIGDLPLDLQVKLLRVIQEGQFERLGSSKTIHVDVRIIAATNQDLDKMVQDGKFRKDLFYRLNVFPITVPPLRERIGDLPLLTEFFVKELGETMAKRVENIPRKELKKMQRYPWPGNVRELRNVIEQSMIITIGRTLEIQLPGAPPSTEYRVTQMEKVERMHILNVLESTGWRIKGKNGASELLELKPSTLYSRMKKLGIQRPANKGRYIV
jgi:transcriptional regulator with GAF, ATPase, and Fis domain